MALSDKSNNIGRCRKMLPKDEFLPQYEFDCGSKTTTLLIDSAATTSYLIGAGTVLALKFMISFAISSTILGPVYSYWSVR